MIIKELDVTNTSCSFQKIQIKIILGSYRVNKLKSFLHWSNNFHIISMKLPIGSLDKYKLS